MNATRGVISEACYCGTRWTPANGGYRECLHCDRPPAVKVRARIVGGVPVYSYRCPDPCVHCATVNRKRWDVS